MNVPPSRIQLRTGSTIGSPRFCAEFHSHRNSVCICSVNVVALWRASRTPTRHRPVELERAPFAQGQIQTALPSAPIAESAPAPVVPAADVHRGPPAAFAPPLPAPASLNALPQVPQPAPFPIPSPASSRPDHTRTSRFVFGWKTLVLDAFFWVALLVLLRLLTRNKILVCNHAEGSGTILPQRQ